MRTLAHKTLDKMEHFVDFILPKSQEKESCEKSGQ